MSERIKSSALATLFLFPLLAVSPSAPLHAQATAAPVKPEAAPAEVANRGLYYADTKVLDPSLILQPAPAQDSATTKSELVLLHQIEQTRTPGQIAAAQADAKEQDIFIFKDVLGDRFTPDSLPLTAALSGHVRGDAGFVTGSLKRLFQRPRPYNFDSTLHSVCGTDKEFSYPSGHSMLGFLMALTLIELVPEKHDQILARADDYTHNRLVCGVHYPSDIEASRKVAYAVFGYMMATPKFQSDLAAARAELRQRLNPPVTPAQ